MLHKLAHKLGFNLTRTITWEENGVSMIGSKCSCGKIEGYPIPQPKTPKQVWACIYCGKTLPACFGMCCGEVGHTELVNKE